MTVIGALSSFRKRGEMSLTNALVLTGLDGWPGLSPGISVTVPSL
jgi:hypothetical protein